MFGDGLIHVQAGLVEPRVAAPVLHRDDGQVGVDLLLGIEQPRQLADRHAVPDWHRRQVAGEADRRLVERRALDLHAADRVRPVEHDDGDLAGGGLLQDVGHRRHVGVEARADVLQIDDDRVEPASVSAVGRRVAP